MLSQVFDLGKGKGNFHPLTHHKTQRESRGIALHFLYPRR